MKKFYLFFQLFILFSFLSVGTQNILAQKTATLPFTESFNNATTFSNLWTVVDKNNDGKTWTAVTASSKAQYTYSKDNVADDYLISPLFDLVPGVTYRLSFNVATASSSYKESLKVFLGTGLTATDQNTATPLADYPSITGTSYQTKTINITVPGAGQYCFSFYACSAKDLLNIYLQNVKLEALITVPAAVTDVAFTKDAGNNKKALLSWKNPTKDTNGNTLSQTDFNKIEIYRNNELAQTITDNLLVGETMNWSETVTESGKYQYKIIAYSGNNKGGEALSNALWLGDGLTLPYQNALDTESKFSTMTVIDGNNDASKWTWSSSGNAQYYMDRYNSANDYLVTPPLTLSPGVTYKISFEYTGTGTSSGYYEKMQVKLGKAPSADALTTLLKDYPQIALNAFTKDEVTFTVPEADNYFLSFYCYSDKQKGTLKIKNIVVEKPASIPAVVTNASVVADGSDALRATLTWTNPIVDTYGAILSQADFTAVKIYRDGASEPVTTISNPLIGAQETWEDQNVPAIGSYSYKIVTYNGDNKGGETTVKTWIGGALTPPYTNNFTQSEFNDVTVINANNDVDASNNPKTWTWETGDFAKYYSYTAPDDWMIFPRVNLVGGQQYKITFKYKTGGSYSYFVKQRITLTAGLSKDAASQTEMISDFTDIAYSTFVTDKTANFTPATSGAYYLGLHLCTASSAEYIYIDSYTVEASSPSTGLNEGVNGEKYAIFNQQNELIVSAGNENIQRISVLTPDGKVIYSNKNTNNSSANINAGQWNTGVYIVQVETSAGFRQYKLIKK
ncbi:MAG: choice-of-anchor J domain-containing protein [Paludibacteraceae bacterium]